MTGRRANLAAVVAAVAAVCGAAPSPAASQPAVAKRPQAKGPDLLKPSLETDKLSKSGKVEEAGKKFDQIWIDLRKQDPNFASTNAPVIVDVLRSHCLRSRAAKDRFRTLRDQAADAFDARGKQMSDLAAWIVLNRVVDQDQKTLDWWDRVKKSPFARDILTRFRTWLEPVLERNDRLGDLAMLIDDPVALVKREYEGFRSALRTDSSELNYRVSREVFLTRHARHYACLLLADRERDATRLATEAMTLDHTPQMVGCMVKAALDCGKASRQHLDWLAAVDPRNELGMSELRKQVEEFVGKAQQQPDGNEPHRPAGPGAGPIRTAAAPALPNITSTEPPENP